MSMSCLALLGQDRNVGETKLAISSNANANAFFTFACGEVEDVVDLGLRGQNRRDFGIRSVSITAENFASL